MPAKGAGDSDAPATRAGCPQWTYWGTEASKMSESAAPTHKAGLQVTAHMPSAA